MKFENLTFPDDLFYSKDHMYTKIEGKIAIVGLTDYGQDKAEAIEYIDIVDEGEEVEQGRAFTSIETGKWVGALKSPLSGTILEFNEKLEDQADLINKDPYGEGWIVKIEPSNLEGELGVLLRTDKYIDFAKEEREEEKKK